MFEIEERFLNVDSDTRLWLGRTGNKMGPAILLLHGAIENSKIFYSSNGKGLAPYLANNGFDVFMVDLRGKGKSIPAAKSGRVMAGQHEIIKHDLPLLMHEIEGIKGKGAPVHFLTHSWGGVLVASFLARYLNQYPNIKSLVFIASKRKIYVQHIRRWLMVDLAWTLLGTIATVTKGYLPAKRLRMGSDDEPASFYFQCNKWVYSNSWIDPVDKFNYKVAFENMELPPVLSLTGVNDHSLGNIKCVNRMLSEMQVKKPTSILLGKQYGNLHNYGHIDILTHSDAPNDHFCIILNWLNQHN